MNLFQKAALKMATWLPTGSVTGTAARVLTEVQKVEAEPLTGAEKKADVLARVDAATPQIGLAISQLIDAIVAVRKAIAALRTAYAAVQAKS